MGSSSVVIFFTAVMISLATTNSLDFAVGRRLLQDVQEPKNHEIKSVISGHYPDNGEEDFEKNSTNLFQAYENMRGVELRLLVLKDNPSSRREWLSELDGKLSPLLTYHRERSLKAKKSPPKMRKPPKKGPPTTKKSPKSSPPKKSPSPKGKRPPPGVGSEGGVASPSSPPTSKGAGGGSFVNVKDYVVGKGANDESKGFLAAFAAACAASASSSSQATLLIPSDVTILTIPVVFQGGGCGSGVIFQIDGTVVGPQDPTDYPKPAMSLHALIYCTKFSSLTFTGKGVVDGNGMQWWTLFNAKKLPMARPNLIYIHRSANVLVEGVTFRNAGFKHISFFGDDKVVVQNIVINSASNSPNTDGIHISSTSNIVIQSSTISCGDDNVAVYMGANNVVIQDLNCPAGHGISVGSLGGNGLACVSNVLVQRISITGLNGARIKTVRGGSGAAFNIQFKDIQLTDVSNGLVLNQFYSGGGSGNVAIVNVDFSNIQGTTSLTNGIKFECDPSTPCVGISLNGINVKSTKGSLSPVITNAFGASTQVTSPSITPLTKNGLTSSQMNAINNNMALCGFPSPF